MRWGRATQIVVANVRRDTRAFVLSSFGLIVGVATFTFFVSLGLGIQDRVINRIYPVNQVEVEPATVGVVGLRQAVIDDSEMGQGMVNDLRALPHVTAVYPKMRSRMQARLWGGKSLFGHDMRTEAFFDGLDPALVVDELQRNERIEDKRARDALRTPEACKQDDECPLGQRCAADERCRRVEHWEHFRDHGMPVPCVDDGACVVGAHCAGGLCRTPCGEGGSCGDGAVCLAGSCETSCERDAGCPTTHHCQQVEGGEGRVCAWIPCSLSSTKVQYSGGAQAMKGRVTGRCANGADPSSSACEPMACPGATYCAATQADMRTGYCEEPIPVLLSPFLIEVFNSSVASSLGLQPLDGTEALLGVGFRMNLGGSFFTGDMPVDRQTIRVTRIVGFTNKALDFGATMPIDTVRALNARFKGRESASNYGTFVLETEGNEDMSALIASIEARGLTLSRKSKDARKAADMLFILTLVFSFISVVIMGVAAVNITHTFLMILTERRYEIGILRAIGASRAEIQRLVLAEAGLVGIFGAVVGELVMLGGTWVANVAAERWLAGVPFKPDDFFVTDWRVLVGAIFFALVFCVIGAAVPARRAARMDPARVLVS
jgi:ABC-type antimicrobial peptide transport system permease subunit